MSIPSDEPPPPPPSSLLYESPPGERKSHCFFHVKAPEGKIEGKKYIYTVWLLLSLSLYVTIMYVQITSISVVLQ